MGILTSGGDAPGMNAAIRAASLVAMSRGVEVIGIRHGYRGLLAGELAPIEPDQVASILREGGTILRSARCPEFQDESARHRARAILKDAGIEGVVVIGGNGSLTGALALGDPGETVDHAPLVVGVPASIDNDIALTGLSIGVDTAMNTIVEACDKIADTASAHDRTFIIEVMGRDCGYLAMTSAIASGADLVLFPEAHKSDQDVVDAVVQTVLTIRKRSDRARKVMVIKAEGVRIPTAELKQRVDEELGEISGEDPGAIETRVTVLGHVVRGGRPSAFDRLLGSRLANVGVRALLSGQTLKMAAWMPPGGSGVSPTNDGSAPGVPGASPLDLPDDIATRAEADPYCWIVDLRAALEATQRLIEGESPLARWRASVFDELGDVFLL